MLTQTLDEVLYLLDEGVYLLDEDLCLLGEDLYFLTLCVPHGFAKRYELRSTNGSVALLVIWL